MASPASSDEGEIIENGVGDSKATSLPLSNGNGTGVDRPDRNRARYSRSRSPEYDTSSRVSQDSSRRSRSPRGLKRSRNDRGHHRSDRPTDPRSFSVRYEDSRRDSGRSRYSYADDVQSPQRSSALALRYDDGDRNGSRSFDRRRDHSRDRFQDREEYPDKRRRNRSRPPYRPARGDRDRDGQTRRDADRSRQAIGRDPDKSHRSGLQASSKNSQDQTRSRRPDSVENHGSTSKADAGYAKEASRGPAAANGSISDTHAERQSEKQEQEEILDPDAEIERRRRRRQELLAKARGPTPMLVQALQASEKTAASSPAFAQDTQNTQDSTPMVTEANTPRSVVSSPSSPGRGLREGMSPAVLDIVNDQELMNTHSKLRDTDDDGPSAADYDPTVDMREDEMRDGLRHGQVGPHGEIIAAEQKAEIVSTEELRAPQRPSVTSDATGDDDFDMFADDFDEEKFAAPKPVAHGASEVDDGKLPAALADPDGGGILEGDDKDGYYKIRIGEIMNGRYQVQTMLGKGMFSGVARAVDITNKQLVAVKMMRNNDALKKGGFVEINILQKLNDTDPENRKHIVKFERHFEHKGHLCLAFENLSMNLREVLRKFGNNVGINLSAVRSYAHQTFVALAHMRKCTIIHADLKPDNILVNESRNILKICDLGTAIDRSDAATSHNEITPYLVSRFYRAPEIILGMPYEYAVDMWSIGCTLYELYTGKILFTGDSNNQMLKAIMEIRGKFSTKLVKRGQLAHMHFDEMGNFISLERDKLTGQTSMKTLAVVKPTRDLRTRLTAASTGMTDAENRDLNHFIDLLDRCLALNPDKRITPSEALKHPFFLRAMGPTR